MLGLQLRPAILSPIKRQIPNMRKLQYPIELIVVISGVGTFDSEAVD